MKDDIISAYNDAKKIHALICEYGAVGILKALIQVLHETDQHTIDGLKVLEYAPNCYKAQRRLIAQAVEYAQRILNIQEATYGTQWCYTLGLNADMVRVSIKQFQNKTSDIFIAKNTLADWKKIVVLLESIEQLYVPPVFEGRAEVQDELTEKENEANREKLKQHVPALSDILGVAGQEFALAARASANIIRGKITDYELQPPVAYQVDGIPLYTLNKTVKSEKLSKLMALKSLLNDHSFSSEQIVHVSGIREQAIACLKGYLIREKGYFFSATDADLVLPVLNYFQEELDPKLLLLKLFDLQVSIQAAGNIKLSNSIQDIIVSACDLARLTSAQEAEPSMPRRQMSN